jgi:serine/threonine-protein kinase SRPK3
MSINTSNDSDISVNSSISSVDSYSIETKSSHSQESDSMMGDVLINKYLLIYLLGSGSFAKVWLSYHFLNKKFYAIKIQNLEDYDSGIEEVELLKEFEKYNSHFINKLFEYFTLKIEQGEHVCMVFELMAGSLYDIMKIGTYSHGLALETVKKIIYQTLLGMDILNSKCQVIHTDIKPENILVCGLNNKIEQIIKKFKENKEVSSLLHILCQKKKVNDSNFIVNLKNAVKSLDMREIENTYSKKNRKKKNDLQMVHEKYIHDINIKLADFGTCKTLNYKNYHIQTRYYRAPEIIMEYKYNENCDMWSIGCVLYELLIGELLFDPDKKRRFNRDRNHIYDMICLLGKVPDHLIEKSGKKSVFFKKNGLLKGMYEIEYYPLYKLLFKKLNGRHDINQEQLFLTIDLLYKLLNYDPFNRPSPKVALQHKWFESISGES